MGRERSERGAQPPGWMSERSERMVTGQVICVSEGVDI
jgi:hypothetical protein